MLKLLAHFYSRGFHDGANDEVVVVPFMLIVCVGVGWGCVRVCVCVRACVRACVCVCVCTRACVVLKLFHFILNLSARFVTDYLAWIYCMSNVHNTMKSHCRRFYFAGGGLREHHNC